MSDQSRPDALVVRYRPEAVERARSMVEPSVRRRAWLALALAALVAVLILVPFALDTASRGVQTVGILLLATLVLPGLLAAVAIRRLRRPPHLPTVAFTVTREHVVFEPQESTGLRPRLTPAQRWDLGTTTARVATGEGPGRLELTSTTADGARTRAFPVDHLDVAAATILKAVRRA